MKHAITYSPLIQMRIAPSEKSELTNQLLFGEQFQILEEKKDWCYIKNHLDEYTGWISKSSDYYIVEETQYKSESNNISYISDYPLTTVHQLKTGRKLYIPGGSILPFYNEKEKTFKIGHDLFQAEEDIVISQESKRDIILQKANEYMGAPYLWGGKSIFGIDCSGFIQVIFRMVHLFIPRDSSQQVEKGTTVSFIEEAQKGDLAFFDNEEGNISHVGIITGTGEIIHASGKVRRDNVDHQGIYNRDQNKYTHKLRVVKNVVDAH